jgi:ferrous iron transport protein A
VKRALPEIVASILPLSQLSVGSRAVVREFDGRGPVFVRLREMGVVPGTSLSLVRTAPLGDPLEIEVRGYRLSVRKEDAAHVVVEPAVG